jgi:hypothetical protein
MLIETNNIGGQTLRFWRRRKTSAGEKKMSITSSQNDDCAGFDGAADAADSVMMAGGERSVNHDDTPGRARGTGRVGKAKADPSRIGLSR